jgi:hypothetical protein
MQLIKRTQFWNLQIENAFSGVLYKFSSRKEANVRSLPERSEILQVLTDNSCLKYETRDLMSKLIITVFVLFVQTVEKMKF